MIYNAEIWPNEYLMVMNMKMIIGKTYGNCLKLIQNQKQIEWGRCLWIELTIECSQVCFCTLWVVFQSKSSASSIWIDKIKELKKIESRINLCVCQIEINLMFEQAILFLLIFQSGQIYPTVSPHLYKTIQVHVV